MLLDQLLTRSDLFAQVLSVAKRVAQTDANILIGGETGTGKDFLAELIHDAGPRRSHLFLKVDCASIPSSLVESELFGYEKGAFSDAVEPKKGKLLLAGEGTIYLDGINHFGSTVQSKLLRFVQERKVEPLGGSKAISVRSRLMASCSMPLRVCLEQKQIRDDLYYRLAAVAIDLPPLRERMQDLESLAGGFMEDLSKKYNRKARLNPDAWLFLKSYSWPGNIRELHNLLEQAVIHAAESIGPDDMNFRRSIAHPDSLSFAAGRMMSLDDLEKAYIVEVLRSVQGQQGKAARILKINRKTLLMKKRKYGLEQNRKRTGARKP
jgi:transcriptional regulator with PAS, ATPase and Fis domain